MMPSAAVPRLLFHGSCRGISPLSLYALWTKKSCPQDCLWGRAFRRSGTTSAQASCRTGDSRVVYSLNLNICAFRAYTAFSYTAAKRHNKVLCCAVLCCAVKIMSFPRIRVNLFLSEIKKKSNQNYFIKNTVIIQFVVSQCNTFCLPVSSETVNFLCLPELYNYPPPVCQSCR